jgi:hypothetical protein
MGLVSFSPSARLASLSDPLRLPAQSLARWLRSVTRVEGRQTQDRFTSNGCGPSGLADQDLPSRDCAFESRSVNRLKIVRETDSAVRRGAAGRMMISGRMADVCEELERMVQSEAQAAIKGQN